MKCPKCGHEFEGEEEYSSRSDKWDAKEKELKISLKGDHIHAIAKNGKCVTCGLTPEEIRKKRTKF